MFGTLFNDIVIYRRDNQDNLTQSIKVPIAYGPMQKFLAKIEQDPNLTAPAMILPRMSFEITGMTYDGERKLTSAFRNSASISGDNGSYKTALSPTPYNLEFELNIMTKYMEDGTKIVEQILPFFKPEFTPSVKLIDDLEYYLDVPIILNSITTEDTYEGSFEERRALIWTLSFTMKGWYFGPTTDKKVIKFATVNTYDSLTANDEFETVTVQPGLTANGEPTTNINETVPYADINGEDDWDYIVTIIDNT
jgi:hypothetical protein